jgi:protease-4
VALQVDSGGGSALASDLIWRAVQRLATRKPVVAVMGAVAGSGGYYVLTHATRVLAAPTTITGSIGVVMGKFVLEEFNARYGLNPETLRRGRFATLTTSARGWDDAERDLLGRHNDAIYQRFVNRVAEGRGLSATRVNEIGRGRIWSGRDAPDLGPVDEIGDVPRAAAPAKERAGLHPDAPTWNVRAPEAPVLPSTEDPTTLARAWAPLLREHAWLVHPARVRVD